MYNDGRCGFYHADMAKKGIGLEDNLQAIKVIVKGTEVLSVRIDRVRFNEAIKIHAAIYVSQLRNAMEFEKRENFRKGWNIFHE
jgi:hypothetical protein